MAATLSRLSGFTSQDSPISVIACGIAHFAMPPGQWLDEQAPTLRIKDVDLAQYADKVGLHVLLIGTET